MSVAATSGFGFGSGGQLYRHPAAAAAAENGRDYYYGPELSQPDHIAAAAASASGAVSSPTAVKANFLTDRGRDRQTDRQTEPEWENRDRLTKEEGGRMMPLPATTKRMFLFTMWSIPFPRQADLSSFQCETE